MPRTYARKENDCIRCCEGVEGRPLGADLQGQAPNHLKLRRLRAGVVSVKEKVRRDRVRWESGRRTQANRYIPEASYGRGWLFNDEEILR